MKTIITIAGLFFILFFNSCRIKNVRNAEDYIITEKDLIPEGLTFDSVTQTIYVSSTYKRKIISIDKEDNIKEFTRESQDDIKSVIGMAVDYKRRSLWAISSEANEVLPLRNPGPEQWRSAVYQFNLNNGNLIKKYILNKDSIFLNDLAISTNGTIYITDTKGNAVYLIKPGADTIELFIETPGFHFLNGISFADRSDRLFVCSSEGILSVDLKTKNYSLLPVAANIITGGIDGLSFNEHYFIAHQSTKVVRFYLSPGRDSILSTDTLDSGKEFDSSTTGEVSGNYYYYIVNSQIQSGIDYETRSIKPMDSLENIIIRKIKL